MSDSGAPNTLNSVGKDIHFGAASFGICEGRVEDPIQVFFFHLIVIDEKEFSETQPCQLFSHDGARA
ncbi:hypothetical protein D9M71_800010 [compost metagenome]